MIQLRFMTEEDFDLLLKWGEKTFSVIPGYSEGRYSSRMARKALFSLLESPRDKAVCLVATIEGKPVGTLLGASTSLPFSEDTIATEFMFYVEPGNPKVAKKLLEAYEYWAKITGCTHISVGLFEENRKKTGMTRRGYSRGESLYFKRIN